MILELHPLPLSIEASQVFLHHPLPISICDNDWFTFITFSNPSSSNQSQDEANGRTQPEYRFENSNLLSQESEEPEIEQLTFNSQSSSGQPIAYLCNCLALTLKGCQEWDTIWQVNIFSLKTKPSIDFESLKTSRGLAS